MNEHDVNKAKAMVIGTWDKDITITFNYENLEAVPSYK
jgi:hypothetical protein